MKVYEELIQGTEEWLDVRKGVFTASEMGVWITSDKRNKTQEKAAFFVICRNLAEMSGCELEPFFENWAMRRGTALEPEARQFYTEETGNKVEQVGFALHDNGGFGCSPDGFIDDRKGMLQIKCPVPNTHCKYLLEPGLPDTHKVQVHFEMAVTGAQYNDFYAYCPGLPSMLYRVERDEYTESILSGLLRLSVEFKSYQSKMSALWAEMKKRQTLIDLA